MNSNQLKRYQKLSTERFYLLDNGIENDQHQFHISGSTKNIYKVSIYTNTGKAFCTCPDAKSWAVKCHCVCKHVLFVLYRVLRIFNGTEHDFFRHLTFSATELVDIYNATDRLSTVVDETVVDKNLSSKYKNLQRGDTGLEPNDEIDPEEMCGVCFLDFVDEPDHKTCKCCHKPAHVDCINKWISSGNSLCVYCRQNVWGKTTVDGEYKNLG